MEQTIEDQKKQKDNYTMQVQTQNFEGGYYNCTILAFDSYPLFGIGNSAKEAFKYAYRDYRKYNSWFDQ